MDWFILDTNTKHTSLMFNEYLFHLCDYTCSNVCMYVQLLDDPTKFFFLVFYLFLEVIFATLVLKFFIKMSKSLCWKTLCLAILWLLSWVVPHHNIFKEFQFLKNFRQRVSRVPCEWVATQTWLAKICPMHLHILWVVSWSVRESQTREMQKRQL